MAKSEKLENFIVAVLDMETDPFKFGRPVAPFCWGFYTAETYKEHWDNDPIKCIQALIDYLHSLKRPHLIYAHNGGKFDYLFFPEHLENPIKIINGRISECKIGQHTLRDSYSIFPDRLSTYKKDDFDYGKMERHCRNKYKKEILYYQRKDCEYLYDIVTYFIKRFGFKLTIGATAIAALRELHPFPRTKQSHDERFRPYYFGGRCEMFESGIIEGQFKIIDVNSMYPDVMKNYVHPQGEYYTRYSEIDLYETPVYFLRFYGLNEGALPVRTKDGLDFNVPEGEFFACSHEIKVALRHGKIKIFRTLEILVPDETIQFGDFVDKYIAEKITAKELKRKLDELFAKRLLNSAYGKAGQNPDNHGDYIIVKNGEGNPNDWDKYQQENIDNDFEWELFEKHSWFSIWQRPTKKKMYYDVAIAASITSAARAKLLEAKFTVKRPIYCDTDSFICESTGDLKLHDTELGAWKLEEEPDLLAIAGKKLYAAFKKDGKFSDKFVKGANKGVQMHPSEIVRVCKGEQILCQKDSPTMKLSGEQKFTARNIKTKKNKAIMNTAKTPA